MKIYLVRLEVVDNGCRAIEDFYPFFNQDKAKEKFNSLVDALEIDVANLNADEENIENGKYEKIVMDDEIAWCPEYYYNEFHYSVSMIETIVNE